MGERELRAKYGGKLAKAINRAIRAEVKGGTPGPGELRRLREGVELEINPYCRRAITKGVELASSTGGACTVVTLGPPSAEDSLLEALAAGAPVIASDTPSLRAMGGSEVACLDPLDGLGWLAAIRRLAEAPAIRVRDHTEQTTQAVSQEVYFRRIETFLGGL